MSDRLILCPVCRQAVRDADYYAHARSHQSGHLNLPIACAAVVMSIVWWVGFFYLVSLVLA